MSVMRSRPAAPRKVPLARLAFVRTGGIFSLFGDATAELAPLL